MKATPEEIADVIQQLYFLLDKYKPSSFSSAVLPYEESVVIIDFIKRVSIDRVMDYKDSFSLLGINLDRNSNVMRMYFATTMYYFMYSSDWKSLEIYGMRP